MPTVYIKKEFYDKIIQKSKDVTKYVNDAIQKALTADEEVC